MKLEKKGQHDITKNCFDWGSAAGVMWSCEVDGSRKGYLSHAKEEQQQWGVHIVMATNFGVEVCSGSLNVGGSQKVKNKICWPAFVVHTQMSV